MVERRTQKPIFYNGNKLDMSTNNISSDLQRRSSNNLASVNTVGISLQLVGAYINSLEWQHESLP